jgi:mRNA interferase RelE/StbE
MTPNRVYVLPTALAEIDRLPGHVRARLRRAILALRNDEQPPHSRSLSYELGVGRELRRLRLDEWRVVYLVDRESNWVYVLAVRRRPPYGYDDLRALVA